MRDRPPKTMLRCPELVPKWRSLRSSIPIVGLLGSRFPMCSLTLMIMLVRTTCCSCWWWWRFCLTFFYSSVLCGVKAFPQSPNPGGVGTYCGSIKTELFLELPSTSPTAYVQHEMPFIRWVVCWNMVRTLDYGGDWSLLIAGLEL